MKLNFKDYVLSGNESSKRSEYYDYREFSVMLSEHITKHIDSICRTFPTKRKNPEANYRRRLKKE